MRPVNQRIRGLITTVTTEIRESNGLETTNPGREGVISALWFLVGIRMIQEEPEICAKVIEAIETGFGKPGEQMEVIGRTIASTVAEIFELEIAKD